MKNAKQFLFALEQCRQSKGMKWHGSLPEEIIELYDLPTSESQKGHWIAGVYVQVLPQYEAYTPEWAEEK